MHSRTVLSRSRSAASRCDGALRCEGVAPISVRRPPLRRSTRPIRLGATARSTSRRLDNGTLAPDWAPLLGTASKRGRRDAQESGTDIFKPRCHQLENDTTSTTARQLHDEPRTGCRSSAPTPISTSSSIPGGHYPVPSAQRHQRHAAGATPHLRAGPSAACYQRRRPPAPNLRLRTTPIDARRVSGHISCASRFDSRRPDDRSSPERRRHLPDPASGPRLRSA